MNFEKTSESITTKEFAQLLKVSEQTIRGGYSKNGHYLGIQPIKLPNRFLRWPLEQARSILAG